MCECMCACVLGVWLAELNQATVEVRKSARPTCSQVSVLLLGGGEGLELGSEDRQQSESGYVCGSLLPHWPVTESNRQEVDQ